MMSVGEQAVRSADGTTISYRSVGSGEPILVVGGALRSAVDYMPFAQALGRRFEVHVLDRRGRGKSGPQGPGYGVEKECEDLEAVMAATGARHIFGHSYGGLIALELATRNQAMTQVAVYEPGVSVEGSMPLGWLPAYAERLGRGDRRGAFTELVRGSGHAPAILSKLPFSYSGLILRAAIRGEQWRRMEPLLEANLAEHAEVSRLDGTAAKYADIAADVLLLGGTKSPNSVKWTLDALAAQIPEARRQLLDGLAHSAPDETAPQSVAEVVSQFFAPAPM